MIKNQGPHQRKFAMKIQSDVTLSSYDSDLNLVIDSACYSAYPLTNEGFAFMWAGARATHGVLKGKACFEVKILEHLNVLHLPTDEPKPHVVRVGYSVQHSSLQLGEDSLSYGYCGTGKISTKCHFKDYGTSFLTGDVILSVVDMDSVKVRIGFGKNGKFLGWAYNISKAELKHQALFPHILTKNVSFVVNFGQKNSPYFPLPDSLKDFSFIDCLPIDKKLAGDKAPERKNCEVIMMCGLPGCGKSVWAANRAKAHPDKKYNILGINNIIDKMKVMGRPRKRNYAGSWDILIQMATRCLNKMFEIGSKLCRNYILDQTNVYPTAQRRKMQNFVGYKRVAVVIVPDDAEYKRRCDIKDQQEGKEIPESAVLEMKANFKIPPYGELFHEIIFPEMQKEEAEKLVAKYNEEGRASSGEPPKKQFKSDKVIGNISSDSKQDTKTSQGRSSSAGLSSQCGQDKGSFRGRLNGGRRGLSGRPTEDSAQGGITGRSNKSSGGLSGRPNQSSGRGGHSICGKGDDSRRVGVSRGRYDSVHGENECGMYSTNRGKYDNGTVGCNNDQSGYSSGQGKYDGCGNYDSGLKGYGSSFREVGAYDGQVGFDRGNNSRGQHNAGHCEYKSGHDKKSGLFGGYDGQQEYFDKNTEGLNSNKVSDNRAGGSYNRGKEVISNTTCYSTNQFRDPEFIGSVKYFVNKRRGACELLSASVLDTHSKRDQPRQFGNEAPSRHSFPTENYESKCQSYAGSRGSFLPQYDGSSEIHHSSGICTRKNIKSDVGSQYLVGTETRENPEDRQLCGKTSRWPSALPEASTQPNKSVQVVSSYSSLSSSQKCRSDVKTEPNTSHGSSGYKSYSGSTTNYTIYTGSSQSNQAQSYIHQSSALHGYAAQWAETQLSSQSTSGNQAQEQWSIYPQQPQSYQIYNQYYEQTAGTNCGYGTK